MKYGFSIIVMLTLNLSAFTQTVIRADLRVIYESGGLNVTEKRDLFNSEKTQVYWSWEYTFYYPPPPTTESVGFRMNSVSESIELMEECIRVLRMQDYLGSHDKIVHEYGGVTMVKHGSKPNVIEVWPGQKNLLTGTPFHGSELELTEQRCNSILEQLKNYRPLN